MLAVVYFLASTSYRFSRQNFLLVKYNNLQFSGKARKLFNLPSFSRRILQFFIKDKSFSSLQIVVQVNLVQPQSLEQHSVALRWQRRVLQAFSTCR